MAEPQDKANQLHRDVVVPTTDALFPEASASATAARRAERAAKLRSDLAEAQAWRSGRRQAYMDVAGTNSQWHLGKVFRHLDTIDKEEE